MSEPPFAPPLLLRNPHLQTILSSSRIRLWGAHPVDRLARQVLLDVGSGIRLLGQLSKPAHRPPKALVLLLHGWEGSAHSTYCVRTGNRLVETGYAVFRLNFRDHGGSHHLNEGIFYATLLDEVFEAIIQVTDMMPDVPAFIVGFSLGGNFALRVAQRCGRRPIANLRHIVCISPVLNPEKSTARIDSIFYIRRYFLQKWRRSLLKKQALFPRRYDFSGLPETTSVGGMTQFLLSRFSHYKSAHDYFRDYTLLDDALLALPVPVTLLTAADDPIIPVRDFEQLQLNETTRLIIPRYGGHNGFISGFSLASWYENKLVELFDRLSSVRGMGTE